MQKFVYVLFAVLSATCAVPVTNEVFSLDSAVAEQGGKVRTTCRNAHSYACEYQKRLILIGKSLNLFIFHCF